MAIEKLKETIRDCTHAQKRYLLLRLSGLPAKTVRELTGVTNGTYNTWCSSNKFLEVHKEVDDLSHEYRDDAIKLLRKDNQLAAVLLEGEMMERMRDEVRTGELKLTKTHLAREVYSKLMSDLDYQPQAVAYTWQQRIMQIKEEQNQLEGDNGRYLIEGEIHEDNTNTESNSQKEYQESYDDQKADNKAE